MADKTLKELLTRFGFVTVFDPKFYGIDPATGKPEMTDGETPVRKPALVELDSLTVANINQEGPTKTAKGGIYAETLMRYGKTMRLEMENAIATAAAIEILGGGEWSEDDETLKITDKFAPKVWVEGRTFVIDQATGNKIWINIVFPGFIPDTVFNIALEAEGDFGTFSINGDLAPDKCGVFYYMAAGEADTCEE